MDFGVGLRPARQEPELGLLPGVLPDRDRGTAVLPGVSSRLKARRATVDGGSFWHAAIYTHISIAIASSACFYLGL